MTTSTFDTNTILLIVNILASFFSPLILSISYYIKHIESSSCCNGRTTVKLRKDSEKDFAEKQCEKIVIKK